MTTNELKTNALNLKKIVEAHGPITSAKYVVPELMDKIACLEAAGKAFDAKPSELTAKIANTIRRQVEDLICVLIRNVAENC